MKPKIYIYILAGIILISSIPYIPGPIFLKPFANGLLLVLLIILGASMYIILAALVGLILSFLISKIRSIRNVLVLTIFSTVVFFLSFVFLPVFFNTINRPSEIKIASRVVDSIYKFREETGNYPNTLSELCPKYLDHILRPKTLCIDSFLYVTKDSTFNLYFNQIEFPGLGIERVIYSPSKDRIIGEIMYKQLETRFENWYLVFED